MTRTRETFRPSSHHDADAMWTIRYGEHLIRHHRLDDRRLRYDALSPAKALAVQVARTYDAQYRADDEDRWNDSGSLGAAVIAMTQAYSHLAAVEDLPYLLDGEPQNWNERVPVPMDND